METGTEVGDIVVENDFFSKIRGIDQSRIDLLAIAIPSLMIIIAEMSLFAGRTKLAMWMHLILLIFLTLSTMVFEDRNRKHILRAFILLSLLRILNLSMPVFFEMTLYSYAFIYAPLIISTYVVVKDQELSYSDIGITRNIRYYELPVALIASVVIAVGEFFIIKPGYLIPDLSVFNLLKLSIIMIFFVGLVEELVFRSILQTKLEEMIGKYQGLILASILFGFMHSGYGTFHEIAFTAFAGFIMGGIYIIRRDLLLVTIVHGFVNILLFGILPHIV
ncbi:CPBP family intramembrane metalloprotease [Methanococcoides orientis]|uniref:CPBP family intramembrane glutamic endopeptidase n=1 Tax=Methanococcoides orientis TaxID=2822137 RepID=UPI001E52074F|nr:CPBP family intramembrane glutamic endopeptidase [Methanococcoides orientis]UGV40042.1 CPBP family intramembrane metalloprotease [Methanococcoides orientis]